MSDEPADPNAEAQEEKPVPEDPEFQLDKAVVQARAKATRKANFTALVKAGLSQVEASFDGCTYSFSKLNLHYKCLGRLEKEIGEYVHLKEVNLSNNFLKSLEHLNLLNFMVELDLSKNQIEAVALLANEKVLPYLEKLDLTQNKIAQLGHIKLPSLTTLIINKNLLTSVEELQHHGSLKMLSVCGNKIKTLRLKQVPKLELIYASENQIQAIELTNLALKKLYARKNNLKNPFEIKGQLEHLQHLNLRENKIAALQFKLPASLQSISLQGNPISDELGDNLRKQLTMQFDYLRRVNKVDNTAEDREEFLKELKERIAEKERERKEREEAERERLLAQQQAAGGEEKTGD